MWELDNKEGWAPKNGCFPTVVLEKTLESPLDCKKIQPVNPKGNQSWIFIGRTDAPILWPPDTKSQLIGKDHDTGKDWRQKTKETTEDEIVRWHHWLNGCEFEQALGVGDGQGSLACCSPWGHKESDAIELNWTETVNPQCFFYGKIGTLPAFRKDRLFAYFPVIEWIYTVLIFWRRQRHPTPVLCLENPMDGGAW